MVGERTSWQSSWAGADGTSRLEASVVPFRTLVDGAWVPVDSTLVVHEDRIDVSAPVFPISLNPGGQVGSGEPLGTIEREGHVFKVWFPLELPTATLEGSKVVYDFGSGVRLVVTINSDTTGFIPVIELASQAAAGTFASWLAEARISNGAAGTAMDLAYPVVVSDGLDIAVDEYSQMQATDAEGEVQFFSPPPIMWDSAGATIELGPEVTEVAETDRTIQPSAGDNIATMVAALSGATMVVTPDEGMLASSETVWPVYIDPGFSGFGASQRIAVRTGGYTGTLDQWTDISASSPGEGTGYCSDVASCNVQFKQRLIWKFVGLTTVAGLQGSDIVSASFTVNGVHSYNCTAQTTYLWRTADISASSNWSLSWLQQLGGRTESQRSSCGTNGYRSFDATAGFVWAADNDSTTISLGLMSDESTMATWKRFAYDATISVTYNRAPNAPTSLQLTSPPAPVCVTGTSRPAIATTTPTLSAIVSDPDSSSVSASFEIYALPRTTKDKPVWSSGVLTAISSGQRASVVVPAGKLNSGASYAWWVRGNDGARYGGSSGCEFSVDTTAPSTPTVIAVTNGVPAYYPAGAERGGIGLQGSFTLKRNADVDVVSFSYGFNAPSMPSTVVPDANGKAVITFTPSVAGPVSLTVRSVDAAGNFSPTRTYNFTVATPAEDAIWPLDEGVGTVALSALNAQVLNISGATWGAGPHTLFDSRAGDYALWFHVPGDTARTLSPVVDTTDSFALSAHVFLDPSRVGGPNSLTALSQAGVDQSGFRVEYSATCPGMTNGCWSFAMPDSASGSTETVVRSAVPVTGGEWTHLVAEYDAPAQQMRLWVCEIGTPADPGVAEPVESAITRTATPWAAPGVFELGKSWNPWTGDSRYWVGAIDNVRVFSGEVISEAKIRRLCQGAEASDFPQGNTALDPTTTIGG